ncbi:YbaY family lipoprotein [Rosenbergiella nectarea]|uniref:YbaY family lipoprotein n=1 Tax=Rosenbergiella nectarea TaxID=988801 RepID=UPI001F4E4CE4|nr:YbaY family lipoprotein [Rosenbergiella nectarea]
MKTKHVLGGLLISLAVTSCASHSGSPVPIANDPTTKAVAPFSLSGSVFVRQRMAIPANAALTVTLSDVSGGPGQTKVLAQQVQTLSGKQSPFNYVLPLQGVQLGANSQALLTAAITLNGKVIFASDQLQPITSVASQKKDINLVAVPQVALPVIAQ